MKLEHTGLMRFFLILVAAPPLLQKVKVSHGGLSGHKAKMKFFSDYHCCAE